MRHGLSEGLELPVVEVHLFDIFMGLFAMWIGSYTGSQGHGRYQYNYITEGSLFHMRKGL